jgi:hypothetical protein
MDLIKEKNCSLSVHPKSLTGSFNDFAYIFDTSSHSRQLFKCSFGCPSNCQSQSGFSGSGRTPENCTTQFVLLNETTKWLTHSDEMLLTNYIIDCARAQSRR